MTAPLPKLLLVSSCLPGSSSVGPLFLRELLRDYPADRLAMVAVSTQIPEVDRQTRPDVPTWIGELPNLKTQPSKSSLAKHYRKRRAFRRQQKAGDAMQPDVAAFAREQNPDLIWGVLNAPLMSRLAPAIAGDLGRPLITTVWDPPDGITQNLKLDRWLRADAATEFAAAVQASERVSVISERMKREYDAAHGCDSIVLRHGIDPAEAIAPSEPCDPVDEFILGFAGSMYAETEWRALLRGLDAIGWVAGGRPVRLRIAGGRMPIVESKSPARLDYLGWRDMADVLTLMADCHACYFPYWFDDRYAESVRLCFATKLTSYLTAGKPVLYHGPEDAAVVDFFTQYPVAECCHSNKPDDVAAAIERLAKQSTRQAKHEAIAAAVSEELNLDVFRARFREMIGVADVPATSASQREEVTA